MTTKKLSICLAGLLAAVQLPVQAGSLTFTIEGPGVQTSQVTGSVTTEGFDSQTPPALFPAANFSSPGIGSYTGSSIGASGIYAASAFGGAGGTGNYLFAAGDDGVTLSLSQAGGVGYFGFWWSAGDDGNKVDVTMADGSVHEFTTQSIFDSGHLVSGVASAGGHFGNPNAAFQDQDPAQAFAYVNIYADNNASKITSIQFFGANFEQDNHSVLATLINEGDQSGEVVDKTPAAAPTPSALLLMSAGLGLLGWSRKKAVGRSRA